MRSILRRALEIFLGNSAVRDFLWMFLINNYRSTQSVDKALGYLRDDIIKEMYSFPSTINSGYLHIERAISIIKERGLSKGTVLDIGAAGGDTCVIFAAALPESSVIGFEPVSKTFESLRANTAQYKNIRVYNVGLGSENVLSSINIMNRITSSSIFSSKEKSAYLEKNYFDIVEKEQIEIIRLDDLESINGEIALMKLDIQGYELEALKGGIKTLAKTHFVLLELQNHDIYVGAPKYYDLDGFMRNHGFELFEIIPSLREKDQIIEFDALYINRSAKGK